MSRNKFSQASILVTVLLCVIFLAYFQSVAAARNPHAAFYNIDNDRIFWFIHVSDLHIGASESRDSDNLTWLVGEARTAIDPEFIVAAGDLTDATDGGWLPLGGPYDTEWIEYRQILLSHGINSSNYYDIPGNHDAYDDQFFDYYLGFSIQGSATGQTQFSWTRTFSFGTYHFLGVNTADNTGSSWSFISPYGDHAGLDASELEFIEDELELHSSVTLSMIFGHHPIRHKGTSTDTYIYYGADEFIGLMDDNGVSMYGYGHLHEFSEEFFTDSMAEGVYYLDVNTLGKSSYNNYNIIAIDNNGISIRNKSIGSWPAVVITTPVDVDSGVANNPYTYDVPNSSENSIRALVFDVNSVSYVQYRINSGIWHPMTIAVTTPYNPYLWEAIWDASNLLEGHYNIEVQASSSSGTDSDTISTNLYHQPSTNHPPVANDDVYGTDEGTTLNVAAPGVLGNDSDPDFDPITAVKVTNPAHGTLTLNADGSFDYDPLDNFVGIDTFTYTASDGPLSSVPATVTIIVNAKPEADTVIIESAVYKDKPKRLVVEATSSVQPAADLTVVDYGVMSFSAVDGKYIFNSKVGTPPDSSVTVTSSEGGSATMPLNGGTNTPPEAFNQTVLVLKNSEQQMITLTATDPDNDPLTFSIDTGPAHGTLSGTAPDLLYTPDPDFTGKDSFTFIVNDDQVDSNTATVSILVKRRIRENSKR